MRSENLNKGGEAKVSVERTSSHYPFGPKPDDICATAYFNPLMKFLFLNF